MDRKSDVLMLLKANGSATLAEVAAHLGVSKQGALRHLEALQERGLVEVSPEEHRGPGRPEHVYRLTSAATALFPSGHRALATELVAFLDGAALERFFADRARRLEAEYSPKLAGLDFAARVRELARLSSEQGHMSDVVERPDGSFLLRHCNCPIGDVAAQTGHPCRHEIEMYRRLLGGEVERSSWVGVGDSTCSYVVSAGTPEGRTTERGAHVG